MEIRDKAESSTQNASNRTPTIREVEPLKTRIQFHEKLVLVLTESVIGIGIDQYQVLGIGIGNDQYQVPDIGIDQNQVFDFLNRLRSI